MAIRDFYGRTGKKAGIKPAGGISDAETAYLYYSIVNNVLGDAWLNAEKFRIGASRLANNLIRIIFDKDENFNYF
jgi:deoxyribose-phosphate aldolase